MWLAMLQFEMKQRFNAKKWKNCLRMGITILKMFICEDITLDITSANENFELLSPKRFSNFIHVVDLLIMLSFPVM